MIQAKRKQYLLLATSSNKSNDLNRESCCGAFGGQCHLRVAAPPTKRGYSLLPDFSFRALHMISPTWRTMEYRKTGKAIAHRLAALNFAIRRVFP
jgi:hypothetical protein